MPHMIAPEIPLSVLQENALRVTHRLPLFKFALRIRTVMLCAALVVHATALTMLLLIALILEWFAPPVFVLNALPTLSVLPKIPPVLIVLLEDSAHNADPLLVELTLMTVKTTQTVILPAYDLLLRRTLALREVSVVHLIQSVYFRLLFALIVCWIPTVHRDIALPTKFVSNAPPPPTAATILTVVPPVMLEFVKVVWPKIALLLKHIAWLVLVSLVAPAQIVRTDNLATPREFVVYVILPTSVIQTLDVEVCNVLTPSV